MKVGDKVVVTEDGMGHYLKKPSIATAIRVNYHGMTGHILVKGTKQHGDGMLEQYLTPDDYEVIDEDAELE